MSQFYQNGSYVKFRAKGETLKGYVEEYCPLNGLYKITEEENGNKLKHTFIDNTHWVTYNNICRSYDEFDDWNKCQCGSHTLGSSKHQPYCCLYIKE